jgi:hypothetical protein
VQLSVSDKNFKNNSKKHSAGATGNLPWRKKKLKSDSKRVNALQMMLPLTVESSKL